MSIEKSFDMELFFAALADNTRLRLLNLMGGDEVCVCFFVEVIGTNQPKISRHLAYLRRAGIVTVRRDWKWAHYRIVEPKSEYAAKVLRDVLAWLATEKAMQKDRAQLIKACCAVAAVPSAAKPDIPESLIDASLLPARRKDGR